MKIDAFPHILPRPYFDRIMSITSPAAANLQKRVAGVPALYDLETRLRIMDRFDNYVQILTLAAPPIEALGDGATASDLARLANDNMAELVNKYPDRFVGFVASLPMNDVDATLAEVDRAINDLSALGVQIFTNVNGLPLDDPRFEPFFAKMASLDKPIWVHPYRTSAWPDYPTESNSRFELWWAFGWPYDTAIFMSRLIFSGHLDRYPNLRILTHHAGGMVPHSAGRIVAGLAQLGARTPEEDLAAVRQRLKKPPVEYYKMFYGDTALFGARHALQCALEFFGVDHLLFGTDMPFDPEKGPGFIRDTIADIESLALSDEERQRLYEGNARQVLGVKR